VEKYRKGGQAIDDNMAHVHCMMDTQGYKHTLILCNLYWFSTATCLRGRASVLRYTYTACLVKVTVSLFL